MTGHLEVLGVEFEVIDADRPSAGKDIGICDTDAATITIARGLSPDIERNTILHELVHAISHLLDLKLTERQVNGLAAGLQTIPQITLRLED